MLPGGCTGAGGRDCQMGQGLWGSKHTVPWESVRACPPSSSSHSVPAFRQPSSASAPLPPSLLGSGTALSTPSSWRVHGPEPVQGMPILTKPNWLTCLGVQLLIKSHPCILTPTSSSSPLHTRLYARTLTLTTASSSSPLPSTRRSSVQPHCALASLALP